VQLCIITVFFFFLVHAAVVTSAKSPSSARTLGFGDLVAKHNHRPPAFFMHVSKHISKAWRVQPEKASRDDHHKPIGGEIIVQQHHLVQRRRLSLVGLGNRSFQSSPDLCPAIIKIIKRIAAPAEKSFSSSVIAHITLKQN